MSMNTNETNLIIAAKENDPNAIKALWAMYQDTIRKTHDYSRIGFKCSNASEKSKYACSFEFVMLDLYNVFLNTIRLFDFDNGASFKTFLSRKVNFFALDYIRKMDKNNNLVSYEEISERFAQDDGNDFYDTEDCMESNPMNTDFANTDICDEAFDENDVRICQNANISNDCWHNDAAKQKVQFIMSHYKKGSSKRKLLEAMLKCAELHNEEMKTTHITKMLNCSRANVSALMSAIRKDMKRWGISIVSAA